MKSVIIYGAGQKGKDIYNFLTSLNAENDVAAFCDKKYNVIKTLKNIQVIDLETAKALRLPFLIGVGEKYIEEVKKMLSEEVVYHDLEEYCTKCLNMSKVEYNRAYCAYFHINHMDNYFKVAEDETNLNFFWGDGICREMFMKMNHKNIIDSNFPHRKY